MISKPKFYAAHTVEAFAPSLTNRSTRTPTLAIASRF
jgi:hypothetical protein